MAHVFNEGVPEKSYYGAALRISSGDDVLTYVRVKNLTDSVSSEEGQFAALASLFRGSALTWLTSELALNTGLLEDYDVFVGQIRSTFGLSEVAAKSRAASKYANCYQKASVQLYAIEFKQLASLLQIPDVTAIAQFTKGLK